MLRRRAEDVMRDLGLDAIVSLSLVPPGLPGRLRIPDGDPRAARIRVANPLSVDHSELRTTLLGSLLDAARFNLAHGAERVALFESGRVYLARGRSEAGGVLGGEFSGDRNAPAFEPHCIGALTAGPMYPASWTDSTVPGREVAGFYSLKGILEALAAQLGAELVVEPVAEPFLRPGRAARLVVGGRDAGWLGELHPLVCGEWDVGPATAFQVGLGELVTASSYGREQFEDVTTYPAVREDLAIVVDEHVPAARVREAVLSGGGELLRRAEVFDLYRGEQVGAGRKSIAMRLEFRSPERTLTDEEVAGRRVAITEELKRIGGYLRD
jgi:phenylalanyl-tRNA synthetase beta chain